MSDITLFRPERLTDNPDGGGLATHTPIVDGEVNNLFDDISRVDRVNGDLSLRAVFAIADTPDTELYSGLHMIVAAPPLDERVSTVLFRTRRGTQYAWGDERADAQAAIERYLDESVVTRLIPYDRQLEGQRTVLVFTRPELELPEVGEVFALKNDLANAVEFIRVEAITHTVETFTDRDGDYRARVIQLQITQPLSREFVGSEPNRFFQAEAGRSVVRRTIASDAARYKGVVRLAQDAAAGDLTLKVDSIFNQLVPAATSEAAVVDATPGGAVADIASGANEVVLQYTNTDVGGRQILLPTGALRGSIRISVWFFAGSETVWEQRPDGEFVRVMGGRTEQWTQTAESRLEASGLIGQNQQVRVEYLPASRVGSTGQSWQQPVQIQNRGYVYTGVLRPIPAPGATQVSFRSLGRWYTLQDDGTGALRGEAGTGTGQINFQTGSFSVSLGALPDIDSSVIANFAGSSEYERLDGDVRIRVPAVQGMLDAQNAEPGSVSLSWMAGGVRRTVTDDGAGALVGDGTGRMVYSTGQYELRPNVLPDSSATLQAEYQAAATRQELFAPALTGASVVLDLASPARPGSVRVDYVGYAIDANDTSFQASRTLVDNGSGQLMEANGTVVAGSAVIYGTGQITFPPDFLTEAARAQRSSFDQLTPGRALTNRPGYQVTKSRWVIGAKNEPMPAQFIDGSTISVRYKAEDAMDALREEEFDLPPLQADLTPTVRNAIVPRSLMFEFAGRTYYERAGVLYHSMSPMTGAGTVAGSIDLETGTATITSWQGGGAAAFSVRALLTEVAPVPLAVVHGRTPGSPLRPSTFYIQANQWKGGALVSALADNNGNLQAPGIRGWVDVTTGVFSIAFGDFVLDSALTPADRAEGWYDALNVGEDGYIWRPREAMPGTVSFNCVVQVAATLDPEIIGVNPVRLPMDGRVPVIRRGDTLVIHDPQPFVLPTVADAGQVVQLPRAPLDNVAVYDQRGLGIPSTAYLLDKAAGSIEFENPADLSSFEQPFVAIHSVEEMALCLDAQITGEVSISQPLTRAYTAGNSLCSSAQVIGDVQARYQSLFSQNTWTGVWSDALIGDPPVGGAQYNDATFPLVVLNRDTITQRWRLHFTSPTQFNVIGEEIGLVGSGTTAAGAAPVNPATGEPYFVIRPDGFGGGWSVGNNIRFATVAAGGKVWVARTVRNGPATFTEDRIRLQARWDKD